VTAKAAALPFEVVVSTGATAAEACAPGHDGQRHRVAGDHVVRRMAHVRDDLALYEAPRCAPGRNGQVGGDAESSVGRFQVVEVAADAGARLEAKYRAVTRFYERAGE
jgi:hypothetical protein